MYPKVSYIDLEDDVELDVMAQSVMDHGNQESSPFSSKKVMRESGTHIDGSQYSCSKFFFLYFSVTNDVV